MLPEQNNFKATWQNPNALDWDDAADGVSTEIPPRSYTQDEGEEATFNTPAAQPGALDEEEEEEAGPRPFSSRFEFLQQLGQQLSPILAPLLFGGITFLIILPLVLSGHFYSNVGRLGAIALGFFAIAVLQCMMLYYAGSNNVYWTLSVIGGFFLFLLVGCFAVFGPSATLVFFVVLIILSFIIARLYMRPVPEGSVYIVYAFEKYRRTLLPGLNFLLPWEWVDINHSLHTRERQWTTPEQMLAISRDEDVHLKAMISYQLIPEDVYLAITQVEDWEGSLHQLFAVMLQTVANQLTPDDFITWPQSLHSMRGTTLQNGYAEMAEEHHWERINAVLMQRMRDRVAPWGVLVSGVHIRDITLTPRSLVQDSGQIASEAATPTQPKAAAETNPAGGTSTTVKIPNPVTPTATGKLPKEEMLIAAYKQIQDKKITSPDIIRRIATDFLRIANDPEASRTASFDAAQAAESLLVLATTYEEQASVELPLGNGFRFNEADSYDDSTPVSSNWTFRPPTDDNLTAGG